MAVVLAASYLVINPTNGNPSTITSTSFTPATGELLVVKVITENNFVTAGTPSATGGGITWTKQLENTATNSTYIAVWTGIVTSGGSAITISVTNAGGNSVGGYFSISVERWTGAQVAATPATAMTVNIADPYTQSITTTSAGSVISYGDGDWNAIVPTGVTYASGSSVSEGIDDRSPTNYVAYYAYQPAPTAGSQAFGVTSPSGRKSTSFGIEIQPSGLPPATTNHNLIMMGVGV